MHAASRGEESAVRLLVDANACLDAVDKVSVCVCRLDLAIVT
jgi:hypothetical protein